MEIRWRISKTKRVCIDNARWETNSSLALICFSPGLAHQNLLSSILYYKAIDGSGINLLRDDRLAHQKDSCDLTIMAPTSCKLRCRQGLKIATFSISVYRNGKDAINQGVILKSTILRIILLYKSHRPRRYIPVLSKFIPVYYSGFKSHQSLRPTFSIFR